MRSPTLRGAALAAVVPLALTTLAGCGNGGDSSATGAGPQATASSTPSDTGGPSDTGTTAGSAVTSADFLQLAKAAAAKLTSVKVDMVGDVSGQTYTMKGAMDTTGAHPAMEMTMDMAGLTGMQMRLVDGVMYMNLGSMTQNKFVKFDLNDPNNPLGSLSSSLDQLDPSKMMSELSPQVFKHVTFVGKDANGRHYRAILLTAKAPQLKGLPSSATANLPKTMKYDAWLDDQGRFSKFVVSVPNYMSMKAHYTDYGADVHVTAPPASQITSMPGTGSSM